MPRLSDSLQHVITLAQLQSLLRDTLPSDMDAREARPKLRDALEACGARIAEVREVIARYLAEAATANAKTIDDLAANFRISILTLMPEAEGSGNDLPAIAKQLARQDNLLGHSEEAGFTHAILEHPESDEPLLVFSDWLEEHDPYGLPRAELIRCEYELRQHPTGKRKLELEAAHTQAQFEHLGQVFDRFELWWNADWRWDRNSKQELRASFPHRAIAAFASREVGNQVEILQTLLRLPEQWAGQQRLLRDCKLLERNAAVKEGITGIDKRWRPVPSYIPSNDPNGFSLLGHLHACPQEQRTLLFTKALQGFDTLELVPFALPLDRFIEMWRQGLCRNEPLLQPVGGLNRDEPIWVWEQYRLESLVHSPTSFTADRGGRSKARSLAAGHPGWQVLLVEGGLTDIPRQTKGRTIAGRHQIECNRTPVDYLDSLPPGEVGWTPESYICRFLAALEQRSQVVDRQTCTYLLDSYFPSSRDVPGACWDPASRQGSLGWSRPGDWSPYDGGRAAVRVV